MMAKKVLEWLVIVLLAAVILKTFSTLPHNHHHQISMNLKMELIVDLIKLFNRKSYNKSIIHIHKNSTSFQLLKTTLFLRLFAHPRSTLRLQTSLRYQNTVAVLTEVLYLSSNNIQRSSINYLFKSIHSIYPSQIIWKLKTRVVAAIVVFLKNIK